MAQMGMGMPPGPPFQRPPGPPQPPAVGGAPPQPFPPQPPHLYQQQPPPQAMGAQPLPPAPTPPHQHPSPPVAAPQHPSPPVASPMMPPGQHHPSPPMSSPQIPPTLPPAAAIQPPQMGAPRPAYPQPPHSQAPPMPPGPPSMAQPPSMPPGPPSMAPPPSSMPPGPPSMAQPPSSMPPGPPSMAQPPPMPPGPPGVPSMAPPPSSMPPGPPSMPPGPPSMAQPPTMPPGPPSMAQPPSSMPPGPPGVPSMAPPSSMAPPHPSMYSQGPMAPPGPPGMMPHPGAPGMGGPPRPGMPPQPGMGAGMPPPPGQPGMPPHPGMAGPPQQPQRPRLDPSMMPSAIQVMEDDRSAKSGAFQTGFPTAEIPPLVTTDFFSEDQGNCNPRFMRSTLYCAPATQDLLKHSTIPFGLCVTPFARQHPNEHPPPVVDLGTMGPVRCHRCKAYMCPFMEFQDGGRRFRCPFCKCSSDVPQEYFAHLDHQGRRTDIHQRPELFCGSFEVVATKEYCKKSILPKPPAFIFMLDVSYNSVRSGVVHLFCQNIKQILKSLPKDYGEEESSVQVGFATYDQTIHFYNLATALEQPAMMIVGDVGEMFVPVVEGFLVRPSEAEAAIDALLAEIPQMFAESRITEVVLGPVIQAGVDALKSSDRVGKLFLFHSSLPTLEAPGKLKNREDRKLLGTDKEKTLLNPAGDWYHGLAKEAVEAGCSVDAFLFPNSFIDVATIGSMCATTGGAVFKYNYFQAETDGERFLQDLANDIGRQRAFDAIMRVRTSTGIRPTAFYGAHFMDNTTDVEMAGLDSDHALTLEIRHDDKLEDRAAFVQAAVLFTSLSGQRRLRIHNMSLQTADSYQNLYRCADLDTTVNFLIKFAQREQLAKSPKEVREYLIGRTAQILATYREKCSESAPAGQLILPEVMKLLPLYINSAIRNDAFAGGSELTTDDRAWLLQSLAPMRVQDSLRFLYPRLLPVHQLPAEAADSDAWELPAGVRVSYENLSGDGAWILENGVVAFLWIGAGVQCQWVQGVFGVGVIGQIEPEKGLPVRDDPDNRSLRRLLRRLSANRPRHLKLFVVRQGDKLEPWFRKFLVEDKGADNSPSYVDFLCAIHREIRNILS